MKYLDLSGLEHLIGRLIQWRSTDWTLNVDGATPTVVAPSVADNTEFWSKIAAGDSVTLTFSNGDPTRKAFVISVNRDGGNSAIFVAGTGVKLTQYNLVYQAGSMVLRSRDMPTTTDLNSKLTASGTTEDLTVDTEGKLGLTYGDGFIERLCKDLGKTEVAKDALQANGLLGYGLGLNPDLGETLATGNAKLGALLPTNSGFISSLVKKLVSDNSFGERLATESNLGYALASSNQFASSLASSSPFCNVLASCSTFVSALASNSSFASALAANSSFTSDLAASSSFTSALAASSSFIERLATGELAKNTYFGTSLALYNSAFATALPQNSGFTTALALNSSFQSALANHIGFVGKLFYSTAFVAELRSGTVLYPVLENQYFINALKSALSR